jgi:hypothetical protein
VTSRRAVLALMATLTLMLGWVMALPPRPGRLSVVLVGVGDHGVHASDVPALLAWAVGVSACGVLWRRT